jgi:hypothetical protein
VIATGLESGTPTISNALLLLFNSTSHNLSHWHKNSQLEASTSCFSNDSLSIVGFQLLEKLLLATRCRACESGSVWGLVTSRGVHFECNMVHLEMKSIGKVV